MDSLILKRLPEEEELEQKKAELEVLEGDLIRAELELATLQAELNALEHEYHKVVGIHYVELDEVEVAIAIFLAKLKPKDLSLRQKAEQAWIRSQESKEEFSSLPAQENQSEGEFRPSENLKKLFRDISKLIHPDLAIDEAESRRRHEFMVEVNQAYADKDESRLHNILHRWLESPEQVTGEGTAVELVRVIRKISQVRSRIRIIGEEIESLKNSSIFKLRTQWLSAKEEGRDLLEELAVEVRRQVSIAKERLDDLKKNNVNV